jgi:DNA-binding NarL/FixJ family response regulator
MDGEALGCEGAQDQAIDVAAPVIRVALCDARRWFREALARRLNEEPDIRVLWTVRTLDELDEVPWVANVLVLSIEDQLDRRSIEQLAIVCDRHPGAAVIGLTSGEASVATVWGRLYRTGIATLVSRASGVPALVGVLRHHGGGAAASDPDPERSDRRLRPLLSPREQEVLEWLAAGRTVSEIAVALGLRPKTVANCKQRLYRKLGVHHQAHAVATALGMGLLVPSIHERAVASWP